jgi:hypothetical protein
MGHISTVYGRIVGLPKYGDIGLALRRKNKNVIESLPTDDSQWPWIDRGMFLVQDPESPKMYRNQVIVFGASYKEVETEWEEWLRKFESILKQLYWMTATIHLEAELLGQYTYEWLYDDSLLDTWATDDPVPTSLWSFSGGPRVF